MTIASKQLYYFRLQISQQQFLRYYQGSANAIQVVSECGKRLHLPAIRVRPFLTHTGINGRFLLTIDSNNRFIDLQKIF